MPMAVPTRSAGIGGGCSGCSGDCPSPALPACPPALSPPRRRDEAALLACRPPPRGLESGGREGAACTLRRGGDSPEEETSSEASPASAWREELTCRHSDSRLCSWAPIVRSSPSDDTGGDSDSGDNAGDSADVETICIPSARVSLPIASSSDFFELSKLELKLEVRLRQHHFVSR